MKNDGNSWDADQENMRREESTGFEEWEDGEKEMLMKRLKGNF